MSQRQVWVALLLVVAALPAVDSASGPNPRPGLPTAAPVLALAMADDGTMLAGTDDPGSMAPTPGNPGANVNTWYLWKPDGATVVLGSADLPICGTPTRPQDLCQSPVAAVAIAATGSRFAVASNVVAAVTDGTRAQLALGTSAGIVTRLQLNNPVVAIAMDHAGESVAVLERVANLGAADTTQVEWFDISAANALTAVMPAQGLAGLPTALALSDDGDRLVAVADRVYLFAHGPGLPTALGSGTPQAAAIAGGGGHGLLWGTSAGEVDYAVDGSTVPRFTQTLGGSVSAVAMSRDGRWGAAGNGAGKVRVYRLQEVATPAATVVGDLAMPDAVRQMQFTPDGQYLLVRSASELRLYHTAGNLTQMWRDHPANAPVGLGLSANGNLAATGVGSSVVAYPAVHAIRAEPVSDTLLPGTSRTYDITFRNDGNRPQTADLALWFPMGWFAQIDRQNLTIPVDGQDTVQVKVIVPALQSPGTQQILVNYTLASTGTTGTFALRIAVPERDLALLNPLGPTSLGIRGGETVQFKAEVENRGNRAVTGHLEVAASPASWTATISTSTVSVAPGERQEFTVSLTAPHGIQEGDSGHAVVTLLERPQEPLDLLATMGARFEVTLAAPAFATARAGNATRVDLAVTNAGNVLDSISLAPAHVPQGWQVLFTPGNETLRDLPAGQTLSVTVTLIPPSDAVNGVRVPIGVRATSQGDPTKGAEEEILVTVIAFGSSEPPSSGGDVNWALLGIGGLLVLAIGGFVAGYLLTRRK